MSNFDLDALIQFSELSRALNWSINEAKTSSELISKLSKSQTETKSTLSSQQKKLTEFQSITDQFQEGLVSIRKIEDRLAAWSERFRILEETSYKANIKITNLENILNKKFANIKKKSVLKEKRICDELEKVFENKFSSKIETLEDKLEGLTEKLDNFKKELEKEDENSEILHKSAEKEMSLFESKEKEPQELIKISFKEDPVKQVINEKEFSLRDSSVSFIPDTSKKLTRSNTMLGLSSRITKLESQFYNLLEEVKNGESERNPLQSFLEHREATEIKEEVDKILKTAMNQLQFYRKYFDNLYSIENGDKLDFEKSEEKIEVKGDIGVNFDEKLRKAEEKYQSLMKDYRTEIENLIQPLASTLMELQESTTVFDRIENINEKLDSQKAYLLKLEDRTDKLQKTTMLHLNRSEIGDILVQFAKKLKDPIKEKPEPEDYGPKIYEQEQRLNKIWRSQNNSLEILQKFESKITSFEKILLQLQENKSINVEFKISSLETNLSDQIKEVKDSFKLYENIPELIPLENERYFRSMLLDLRTEINQLKEELAKFKASPDTSIPISVSFEEIQEPINLSMFQNILKQHDTAIRLLANKLIPPPTTETGLPKIAENVVELTHLEELKREMKEMIQKKEENQRLSKQDMELVQKISETVEEKIGKEELGQKAEKEDLKRIYNLLKKRIDILADALRRSQIAHKEEPFFTKKSLKLECASCGRLPSGEMDRKTTENFMRMQNKSPSSGIAFSKILSSLIPNSRGGLRLPLKSDRYLDPISSPKVQKKGVNKNK